MDEEKSCKKCKLVKPLSQFSIERKLLDGRSNTCRICNNKRGVENAKKRRLWALQNPIDLNSIPYTSKVCGICKTLKPFSDFNKNLKLKFGLEYCCRECGNSKMRECYRPRYKEKDKVYHKEYNIKNKDKVKQRTSKYYIDNKVKVNEYGKRWRSLNKDYRKTRDRNYRKNNKELCNLHCSKRRAKLHNACHPQHNIDIEKAFQEMSIRLKKCIGIDFHVDHILPLNKGGFHHHGNLQVIPGRINEGKRDNIKFTHPCLIHYTSLPSYLLTNIIL